MIGKIIAYMRKFNKISQEELAKLCNLAPSTISGWETNYRQPTFENIEKIANTCGYTIEFRNNSTGEVITINNIDRKL